MRVHLDQIYQEVFLRILQSGSLKYARSYFYVTMLHHVICSEMILRLLTVGPVNFLQVDTNKKGSKATKRQQLAISDIFIYTPEI